MKTLLYIILFLSIDKPANHKIYFPMEKVLHYTQEYYLDCNQYPIWPDDLSELLDSSKACWKGPYALEKDIFDSISNKRYRIVVVNDEVIILSAGLDGVFNTEDDLSSSDDIQKKKRLINLYLSKKKNKYYIWLFAGLLLICLVFLFRFLKKTTVRRTNQDSD